eukprot:m.21444 g.21444  ORF g.21444 m.21444 type:complete len:499 (-) comp7145_c0_seq1:97-1593(-)
MGPVVDTFETNHLSECMFYTGGWLNQSIDSTATTLTMDHPLTHMSRDYNHCALRDWLLVSSNTNASTSRVVGSGKNKTVEFVAFIRIDNEVMKLVSIQGNHSSRDQHEPPFDIKHASPIQLVVERGFSSTEAASHQAGSRVLTPVHLDEPLSPTMSQHQWAVDMSGRSNLAQDLLRNHTLADLSDGFDGSWYDNYGPALVFASTCTGCNLRTHEMWNPYTQSQWSPQLFLEANQNRLKATNNLRNNTHVPRIGNGYGGYKWPNGSCEAVPRSVVNCSSFQNMKDTVTTGWVDGWIMEGFFGNEVLPPGCSCQNSYTCGEIHYKDAVSWKQNVQSLAYAAQNNIRVFPIIAQAGCKTPSLEGKSRAVRDAFEDAGYASFLLAVESVNGSLTYGINSMYRETPTSVPYAYLHPRYTWNIGSPTHSVPPAHFDDYQTGTKKLVYARTFEHAMVLYHPGFENTTDTVDVGDGVYINPANNNQTITGDIKVEPLQGLILLKKE